MEFVQALGHAKQVPASLEARRRMLAAGPG